VSRLPQIPDSQASQYRQFDCGGWHGWICNAYWSEDAERVLAGASQLFQGDNVVQWYKQTRNRLAEVRWPAAAGGQDCPPSVVLKSYQSSSVYNSLRLRMGEPRAVRHWNNAWLLNSRGINTPKPVFLAMQKSMTQGQNQSQGMIAVETAPVHQRIREILPRGFGEGEELTVNGRAMDVKEFARICGQYVRQVHDRGIVHRDMSAANILVPAQWDGSSSDLVGQFLMLDINRVRDVPKSEMTMNLRIQDLERLYMPDHLLQDYYLAYAGDSPELASAWQKFLKYRNSYRRIRETQNPLKRGFLKIFTYWPRTG
jgi:hypothetical protein